MYDIIGDIHGHADALELLLQKLGYGKSGGHYSHPGRKAVFVGDYIDRGPQIAEALGIVKAMAEHGAALALMGNHELNAILYNTRDAEGNYLRERTDKNKSQHAETLRQFEGKEEAYLAYIEWFRTLPLYHEEENMRVVHACWDETHIQHLKENLVDGRLTDGLLKNRYKKGTGLYEAVEVTLKGKELGMPRGLTFRDKDGHERTELRIKWWLNPERVTYRQYSVEPLDTLSDDPVPNTLTEGNGPYPESERPVFFGHYWLSGQAEVSVFSGNVCCVDYSVAKQGKLVAYRWDGERKLDPARFVHVSPTAH
ncbi:metallophosphoesterase [Pontibacter harenae]|uniref:metallophosphoesterase n=1 Tax=Pontibacter harenae TaxID=2894083 RepID=UPI001E2E4B36|nr:metallophosphoesterase [Pontibacter harenae]MCC9169166.1 metallophosphoesterase [Pontibacter harenae]